MKKFLLIKIRSDGLITKLGCVDNEDEAYDFKVEKDEKDLVEETIIKIVEIPKTPAVVCVYVEYNSHKIVYSAIMPKTFRIILEAEDYKEEIEKKISEIEAQDEEIMYYYLNAYISQAVYVIS